MKPKYEIGQEVQHKYFRSKFVINSITITKNSIIYSNWDGVFPMDGDCLASPEELIERTEKMTIFEKIIEAGELAQKLLMNNVTIFPLSVVMDEECSSINLDKFIMIAKEKLIPQPKFKLWEKVVFSINSEVLEIVGFIWNGDYFVYTTKNGSIPESLLDHYHEIK